MNTAPYFEKIVDRKIDYLTTEALLRAWIDPASYSECMKVFRNGDCVHGDGTPGVVRKK